MLAIMGLADGLRLCVNEALHPYVTTHIRRKREHCTDTVYMLRVSMNF